MGLTRRRALMAAGSAGLALGAPAILRAATAERRFAILRDGDEIGFHTVRLAQDGDAIRAEIEIEIVVRFLGIAAYRYEMRNSELWRGGRLVSTDSRVNDDGERKTVTIRRDGDRVIVDGPNYSGQAPQDVATTTYFSRDFLTRPTWVSTDAGDLLSVTRTEVGPVTVATPDGPVDATRWRVTDSAAYEVDVDYDAGGEWIGLAFDAGGERATYRVDRNDSSFAAIWSA
jgi:hypothetical protein